MFGRKREYRFLCGYTRDGRSPTSTTGVALPGNRRSNDNSAIAGSLTRCRYGGVKRSMAVDFFFFSSLSIDRFSRTLFSYWSAYVIVIQRANTKSSVNLTANMKHCTREGIFPIESFNTALLVCSISTGSFLLPLFFVVVLMRFFAQFQEKPVRATANG